MPTPLPHRPAALALLAGITLATAPACSWNERRHAAAPTSTAAPTTTASTTTTAVSTPEDPEDEVRAAYLEIMRRYFLLMEHPDPTDPIIARNHVGPDRDRVVLRATQLRDASQIQRYGPLGPPEPHLERVTVTKRHATVVSCLVDDTKVISTTTQKVVNDLVVAKRIRSTLVRIDHRWKLSANVTVERFEGRSACVG